METRRERTFRSDRVSAVYGISPQPGRRYLTELFHSSRMGRRNKDLEGRMQSVQENLSDLAASDPGWCPMDRSSSRSLIGGLRYHDYTIVNVGPQSFALRGKA